MNRNRMVLGFALALVVALTVDDVIAVASFVTPGTNGDILVKGSTTC